MEKMEFAMISVRRTMASNTAVISNSPVNEPIWVDLLINEVV